MPNRNIQNDAAKYFTQFALDLTTRDAQKIETSDPNFKAVKSLGRLLGLISVGMTIKDFWDTFKYNDGIDKIIEFYFI
ncbi:hypothetical protein [Cohnella abietis]|uniref:Uncharacterized protein n=1 Tax=Cohnella abietis TaxID=2507935 RepID=A0A3T1D6Z5_9BACL|nr:hypothetical protein [Cohnella abietis]BBI33841.1 hypothetical protein KCTCHS21_32400 [Cohnella abietis]